MKTREEVIKALEKCTTTDDICDGENCPYFVSEDYGCKMLDMKIDALALLKEQEAQKFFVDESGKITPLPVVVRCKDCKHVCLCDTKEMFPDMPVYAKCTLTDEIHEPDWFCAAGELKDS